jgi:hypothetical protein
MRIAIIIGQSEYAYEESIPVCKKDIFMMSRMIELSAAYDKILVLDDSVKKAVQAKEKIVEFLDSCKTDDKNSKIDELFFYFTGRGDFTGKEFFYLWGDYDKNKKRQTTLLNSELDTLFRQVNPALVVKIVDACYPGFVYYKSSKVMEKYLRSPDQSFDKYYFIFSGHSDQDICGESSMSYFTASIYHAVNKDYGKKIRYKNIIDSLFDDFERKRKVSPVIVVRADYSHTFFEVNEGVKSLLQYRMDGKEDTVAFEVGGDSIIDVIRKDAQRYVDFSFALSCVSSIGDFIEKAEMNSKVLGVFEKDVEYIHEYDSIPKIEYIAKWLSANGADIYADVVYDVIESKDELLLNNQKPALLSGTQKPVVNNVEMQQKIARSYVAKIDLPFAAISMNYHSKYPNITDVSLYLVPLISRTQIFLFYTKVNYISMSWAEQEIDIDSAAWSYVVFYYDVEMIKNGLSVVIKKYFDDVVYSEIVERFLPTGKIYGIDKRLGWDSEMWDPYQ